MRPELNQRGRGKGGAEVALTYERGRHWHCSQFLVRGSAPMFGVDEKAARGGEGGGCLLRLSSARAERREMEGGGRWRLGFGLSRERAGGSGGEGATRLDSAMGLGPDRRVVS
jgi:hypothetical protein